MFGLLVVVVGALAALAGVPATSAVPARLHRADPWTSVSDVLHAGVVDHAFPGAVALVVNKTATMYSNAVGAFTYGLPPPFSQGNPAMHSDAKFDLASLTKVLATTTATMTFYQRGELQLDELVSSDRLLGAPYAQNGKGPIKVLNLLLHNSGYPPDPYPGYWSKAFACPATQQRDPPEVFTCQSQIFTALMKQTLENPIGKKYVYSDLSMITMMYVVGTLARRLNYISQAQVRPDCLAGVDVSSISDTAHPVDQCYYEAYVRKFVIERLNLDHTGFLPPKNEWGNCVPTWNDTTPDAPGPGYRNRVIQGQVSDQNAYALGGIAGHAGLFSTAGDIAVLTRRILFAEHGDDFVNKTTAHKFTTAYNLTQSSRALGWDTNNYQMNTYRGCANLSSTTFTHTGYTGTEVCNDPERGIITVLLTNRVYPKADDESEAKIHAYRQKFNNAVRAVVDAMWA
ncbi:hypothetical protein PTSG_03327 [Salpingoeca rosetta]|uniref:Beta-lactamase-related domain-containing protein n=1 Tax=Salpingoeca rosetta (strain ATCC 50818 / BSB-021) TaxID=946362 RepID=F2U4V1_SALR5|nr:uncharacterized protein PTSG_03327 [Salpingoeca rosetta]EGD82667.1 hypothetical protein PTSG_03327 [Salpingoeca rosetta]|eukprot:XP_004995903.1 hypothetical protein PTSG_03327 [Salpingoeca rosetta]